MAYVGIYLETQNDHSSIYSQRLQEDVYSSILSQLTDVTRILLHNSVNKTHFEQSKRCPDEASWGLPVDIRGLQGYSCMNSGLLQPVSNGQAEVVQHNEKHPRAAITQNDARVLWKK